VLRATLANSSSADQTEVVSLLVILGVAAGVTMVLRRLKLATIPGYVLAGALVGPHALGLVASIEDVSLISDVAILLLMFTIGLHLDLGAIRLGLGHILALGVVTTLLSTLAGWGSGLAAGISAPIALTIGMALSMSSTAVVLRILQQRRQMQSVHGRIAFGILIVQDMIALVILIALPPIAEWAGVKVEGMVSDASNAAGGAKGLTMLLKAFFALSGIAVFIALGRRALPKLLREAAKDTSSETLLVLSAAVALGAAAFTKFLGFSSELGAFLAGFLLAATPFRYQISGQLAPLRDLLMAVFFTTVGLQLNGRELLDNWQFLAIGLPMVVVGKTLILGVSTWLSGATGPTALMTGLGLAQGSEFSLVVLAVAAELGIITPPLTGQLVALVVVSLAIAPSLYDLAERWQGRAAAIPTARWLRNSPLREPDEPAPGASMPVRQHIIIAGFGVVGRNLAEHFAAGGLPFTIVELNPATVSRQRKLGRSIIFGDIANPEVLETAGIHHARAIILTIPDDEATLRACRAIRQAAPKIYVAARTTNLSRAIAATDLGADHVTVEEVATAQDMARQVMAQLAARTATVPHN
jgi:CPA2 family monovalent cation:H+ antiporter-2